MKTSDICQEMDGKVFNVSEARVGENSPPFHPNCRTAIIPHFDDEFTEDEMRAARDEDGQTYYVPADMKYPEWREKFVDVGEKFDIMGSGGAKMDILPNADKAVIPMEKFTQYVLNQAHETGKHKAFVFAQVLGYNVNNTNKLIANIKNNIDKFPAVRKGRSQHGERYEITMQLTGENARTAPVVTGWIIDNDSDIPRLVSAYVN